MLVKSESLVSFSQRKLILTGLYFSSERSPHSVCILHQLNYLKTMIALTAFIAFLGVMGLVIAFTSKSTKDQPQNPK